MRITKHVQVDLTIQDPISVYATPNGLLDFANSQLQGRCKYGCWVMRVLRILRQGDCQMSQDHDASSGNVTVTLEIEGLEFRAGEILNGCEVVRGLVEKSTQLSAIYRQDGVNVASVIIAIGQMFEAIKPGMLISVVVGKNACRYTLGQPTATIIATAFLPTVTPTYYEIVPTIEPPQMFDAVLAELAAEKAALEKLREQTPSGVDAFTKMLQLYADPQHIAKKYSIAADKLPGLDFGEMMEISYLSRELRAPIADAVVDLSAPPKGAAVVRIGYADAVMQILYEYCDQIRTIREMVQIYGAGEQVKHHMPLWSIYKTFKELKKTVKGGAAVAKKPAAEPIAAATTANTVDTAAGEDHTPDPGQEVAAQ